MKFDLTCEIRVLPEYMSHSEYPKNVEREIKTNLIDLGEILEFANELVEGDKFNIFC
jgi:hypothetical protein